MKTNNLQLLCESDSELHILFRSQKQSSFGQIETGFLCQIGRGDGTRAICLFARVILQQFIQGFGHRKFKPTSTTAMSRRLLLCLAPRRLHFARPWTQASKPALTDSLLIVWQQRDVPRRFTGYFFDQASKPSTIDLLLAAAAVAAVCTLV